MRPLWRRLKDIRKRNVAKGGGPSDYDKIVLQLHFDVLGFVEQVIAPSSHPVAHVAVVLVLGLALSFFGLCFFGWRMELVISSGQPHGVTDCLSLSGCVCVCFICEAF